MIADDHVFLHDGTKTRNFIIFLHKEVYEKFTRSMRKEYE